MKVKRKYHRNKYGQIWDDGERYDLRKDKSLKAKKVGKRTSASGSVYYESRRNRSDAHNRI